MAAPRLAVGVLALLRPVVKAVPLDVALRLVSVRLLGVVSLGRVALSVASDAGLTPKPRRGPLSQRGTQAARRLLPPPRLLL